MPEGTPSRPSIRQAVVIVHGMGEQRPLDALTGFVRAALPNGDRFFSKPDIVTGSYESRRFLAPATDDRPQTEFFEYHWAHLMQGNRLGDIWPTFRRLLLRLPHQVPTGLRGLWAIFWALILYFLWAFWRGPLAGLRPESWGDVETVLMTLLGTGAVGVVLTFLVTLMGRMLPGILTNSFVDVVRYLDTSPRSYAVRREIRKGFVELLEELHASRYAGIPRYDRIVIVAHSLGAYIAYDGIAHLWGTMNFKARRGVTGAPDGLAELEVAAKALADHGDRPPSPEAVTDFRAKQFRLWSGLRSQGNPWLITDFISAGTPMYFADLLYTHNRRAFDLRVRRRELPTCPPQEEERLMDEVTSGQTYYSYRWQGRRQVLYDGAPFAVVRWTNMWFPWVPRSFGFLGDWFGGPLRPLLGNGILDIAVQGNLPKRLIPGYAHALYFKFPADQTRDSVTTHLAETLDLNVLAAEAAPVSATEGMRGEPDRVQPTDAQIEFTMDLLRQLGFPTPNLTKKYAELIDPRMPAPTGIVEDWLRSMSRREVSSLINNLAARREASSQAESLPSESSAE